MRMYLSGILILAATAVLVGCGGGGASSSDPQPAVNKVSGQVESYVKAVPQEHLAALKAVQTLPGSGIQVTADSATLQSYAEGDVIAFPSGNGVLDFGFTGKIISKTTVNDLTTIQMRMASVPEVFGNLTLDFDSSRADAKIVGVVAPAGGTSRVAFARSAKKPLLAGLNTFTKNADLSWEGSLATTLKINDAAKISLEGKISNLRIKQVLRYEPLTGAGTTQSPSNKILSTQASDYKGISSEIEGDLDVQLKLSGEATKDNSRILGVDEIWAALSAQKKGFSVEGLDDEDKKGLIPIGGLVFQGGVRAITGPIDDAAKAGSVVVWLYLNVKGEVVVSGDVTVIGWKQHFSHKINISPASSNELKASEPIAPEPASGLYSEVNGKLEWNQKFGITFAADVFVGGIRPFALQATLAALNLNFNFSGNGQYYWQTKTVSGAICVDKASLTANADILLRGAFGVTIAGWRPINAGFELKKDFNPFWKDDGSITEPVCLTSGAVDFVAKDVGMDPAVAANRLYEIDLSSTFVGLTGLADKAVVDWSLKVFDDATSSMVMRNDGQYSNQEKTISKWNSQTNLLDVLTPAKFVISLSAGNTYRLQLKTTAAGFDFQYKSAEKVIAIPSLSAPAIVLGLIDNDCKRLQLLANGGEGAGENVVSWIWQVSNNGEQFPPISMSSNSTPVSLSACGQVTVNLTTLTDAGRTAQASSSINTNDLLAKVLAISPTSASIGTAITFTVTGQNLPLTAIMAITDATCQGPSGNTTTGFSQICTLGGLAGDKLVTVKTASAGQVIDAGRTVSAVAYTGALNPNNGHYYHVIDCNSWTQCRDLAIAKGGNLVTIRSEDEQSWIIATFGPVRKKNSGFWIGLNDETQSGIWKWASGEPVTYAAAWLVGQPSHSYTNEGLYEHYVHLWWYGSDLVPPNPSASLIGWNDVSNTAEGFVGQAIVEYISVPLSTLIIRSSSTESASH